LAGDDHAAITRRCGAVDTFATAMFEWHLCPAPAALRDRAEHKEDCVAPIIRWLTTIAIALLFFASLNLLEMIGWGSLGNASFVTKVHPAVFLLALAAIVALVSGESAHLRILRSPPFLFFLAAGCLIVGRAAFIIGAGVTGGELSAAIVTWLGPVFLLIAMQGFNRVQLDRMGIAIRVFFVLNSLIGLSERAVGGHLIPSMIEGVNDPRAAALLGHPLGASLMTGTMLIYLFTARPGNVPIAWRAPEILLHGIAMFAFGGRSALVFTPVIVVLSAILARRKAGQTRVGFGQRLLPLLVMGAGVLLVFVPLDFVDSTIDRFTNDQKSSETRNAAIGMLNALNPQEWLMGADANRRLIIQTFYHSPYGIELCWIALTMTYGLLVTLPMFVALPTLLVTLARRLDRSAMYMALFFLVVTAGFLSLASKSLLLSQLLVMMIALAQPRFTAAPLRQPGEAPPTAGRIRVARRNG
jgi:hypothetical protein